MGDDKLCLSVNEVAIILGLSRNATYQAIRRGQIPSIRVGKRILVPRVALQAMLTQGTVTISSPEQPAVEVVHAPK